MPELKIGLSDRGELNFNQSFLEVNVQVKSSYQFHLKCWILEAATLSS